MKILFLALESSFTMFVKTKIPKRWAYFIEVATYVKKRGNKVDIIDCLNSKISHGELLKKIAQNDYDVIVLLARPETARSIIKFGPFIKEISPDSRILVYGDTANYYTNFFKKDFIDAIIESGDWECGIDDFLEYVNKKKKIDDTEGVTVSINGEWSIAKKGRLLSESEWVFSDIKDKNFIDKDLYFSITDEQLTITVSKGCPFNCTFCPAVITFGTKDRRVNPKKIIEYINSNQGCFKSIKFFSPTFTYDKEWVKKLCNLIIDNNVMVSWVCTSRPDCLDDIELIELMARAGCKKIAIGIETMDDDSKDGLRKFKHIKDYKKLVKRVFNYMIKNGIEPKPLMMLGIKGQTRNNLKKSFDLLKKFGAREIKAASYSPRQSLRIKDQNEGINIDDIERMDKMTYQHLDIPGLSREEYLKIIYNTDNYKFFLG